MSARAPSNDARPTVDLHQQAQQLRRAMANAFTDIGRRNAPRFDARWPVLLKGAPQGDVSTTTVDMSASGASVARTDGLHLGDELELHVAITPDHIIRMGARVCRVPTNQTVTGMELTHVPVDAQRTLVEMSALAEVL